MLADVMSLLVKGGMDVQHKIWQKALMRLTFWMLRSRFETSGFRVLALSAKIVDVSYEEGMSCYLFV